MVDEVKLMSLEFDMKYKQIKSNLFVGQCKELPFIIVKGKDVEEITEQIKKHLVLYIDTFPGKMKDTILKFGKVIKEDTIPVDNNQSNDKWLTKLLTISK